MAQLIKMFDHISRYETDIYQYSKKYIRLKQEKWRKLQRRWEDGEQVDVEETVPEKRGKLKSFSLFF